MPQPIKFRMSMKADKYVGEPTEEETRERLAMWYSWSPKRGYKDNDLRIHLTCPCCSSDEDTEHVRSDWHVCYTCFIAFTFESLMPVHDPSVPVMLQPYEEDDGY